VKTLRYTLCDVFTERPLAGNPLCVFTDARALDAATMQALAREMNLSETVFVLPPERGGHARLRIFTPSVELPFAGHPTLGAAFVLGGPMESVGLRLELPVGVVDVKLEREGARIAFGWLTSPPALPLAVENGPRILEALGTSATELFAYQNGPELVFVELPNEGAVSALSPNLSALAHATQAGVFVFFFDGKVCRARCFVPGKGVHEDPATGSAVGALCAHLAGRERLRPGDVLRVEQGVEMGRPSTLYARMVAGSAVPGSVIPASTVEVGGSARVVARGQFVI
jgi:trans-2,3-dihydro-3-hydroxyanthranilate isomerase